MTNKYIVDLDNTITLTRKGLEYAEHPLNPTVAKALRAVHAQGDYEIEIFTARNMRSLNGDLKKINAVTKPIAEDWLKRNEVPYHTLTMGKVWCGEDGFYVDDKNLHPEEFVFRTTGPFAGKKVDVVIPFYNEEPNIFHTHGLQKRLERLLDIGNYIYINNGSKDGTGKVLNDLAQHDPRVKVVEVKVNKGYGYGIKQGLKAAGSDYILLNHADGQFDPYTYLLTHMMKLENMPAGQTFAILPRRLNRPESWALRTAALRLLASVLVGRKLGEFNGQPKIWPRTALTNIDTLPDDFCLDLALYLRLTKSGHPVLNLPILEKERYKGVSSWAGQMRRTWRLMFRYLQFAWSMRGH